MSLTLLYLAQHPIVDLPDSLPTSQALSRWVDLLKNVEDRLSIKMIKHNPSPYSPVMGYPRVVSYSAFAHTTYFEFSIELILTVPNAQPAKQGSTFPQIVKLEINKVKFGLHFMDEALREFTGSYGVLYLEYDVPFELESDAWPRE